MLMKEQVLKLPSQVSEFEFTAPDDCYPEVWLTQLDSRPTLYPTWPESTQMTLVAVICEPFGEHRTRGFIMTRKTAVEELLAVSGGHSHFPLLFFRVLKTRVLPLVPGLSLETWSND